MSQDQDYFPELNISELKQQAAKWAEQFPCIQYISLYKGYYKSQEQDNYVTLSPPDLRVPAYFF